MSKITFVYDGDEAGLWNGNKLVASLKELEQRGYSLHYLLGLSQKRLEQLTYKLER